MSTLTAHVFRLPDLGEGLTEAGLVQWLVAVGDTIAVDQAIAEVETAKSVVELPSPFAGVVTALHGDAGDTIAVGAPVLEVSDAAAASASSEAVLPESAAHEDYRVEERAGSGNVLIGYGTSERPASGRRRRSAVHASAATPADTAEAPSARTVAVRSPIVRRLARDLGLDVHAIPATGADGAVTRADVLRAAVDHAVDGAHAPASAGPASSADEIDGLRVRARDRLSPLRRAVSARLSRSRAEIPEATVWVDVDATRLWDLRREIAAAGERAPSLTALFARFALLALEDHPVLASRLDDGGEELIAFEGVNLGVATDTERGLLVPVVPRAHELSVARLDAALRELAETARAGAMPPERMRGSTFTLNNYGGLGVDGSAAIINHPDVAILGIGRVLERPWVVDGEVVARRIAQLSLVFDHRVCDGGYAASFLRQLVALIEQPLRAYGRV
ncbi:dihydrolipoamide acetyltransferase family protein [Microbacterium galbinum]|uniref:dihydrolipoamide acetyltransferase family protein n=1 Tax=Microbacterium galbinum TaxID=2851646 RepID=UPI001FFCFA9D|nr:dihydrolipoamide acetyltransferase family protein [Microbacterium galbinum]